MYALTVEEDFSLDPIPEDDPGRFGTFAVAEPGRFLHAFGVVLPVLTPSEPICEPVRLRFRRLVLMIVHLKK